jgi:hypothetical protein
LAEWRRTSVSFAVMVENRLPVEAVELFWRIGSTRPPRGAPDTVEGHAYDLRDFFVRPGQTGLESRRPDLPAPGIRQDRSNHGDQ